VGWGGGGTSQELVRAALWFDTCSVCVCGRGPGVEGGIGSQEESLTASKHIPYVLLLKYEPAHAAQRSACV
jgi:hypothetical protein